MWGWVRTLILIDLALWISDLFMFGALSDRVTLSRVLANPDFLINLTVNLMVLIYLMDPGVRKAYGGDRDSA